MKEERKVEIDAKIEKQRQIHSILRLRQNDPPTLKKGDPRKLHSYENIKAIVAYNEMYEFEKNPRKSYSIENSDMNQIDFPVNEKMFLTTQYKIVDQFEDKDDFIHMKLTVLGKDQEEIWSLVEISFEC